MAISVEVSRDASGNGVWRDYPSVEAAQVDDGVLTLTDAAGKPVAQYASGTWCAWVAD